MALLGMDLKRKFQYVLPGKFSFCLPVGTGDLSFLTCIQFSYHIPHFFGRPFIGMANRKVA